MSARGKHQAGYAERVPKPTERDKAEYRKAKTVLEQAGFREGNHFNTPYPKYVERGGEVHRNLQLFWAVLGWNCSRWLARTPGDKYYWENIDDDPISPEFNTLDEALTFFILTGGNIE